MGIRGRISGWNPRGTTQLISELDRKSAIRELTVFHERGFIDVVELELRVKRAESAKTAQDIEPLLVDLRDGRRGREEVRASDDERAAALRRLALHREAGQMSAEEYEQRKLLIDEATVPHEITAALNELPPLRPSQPAKGERLASDAERAEAEDRLDREYATGRLEPDEHAMRIKVVRRARTRNEIQSAFSGLNPERMEKPIETVTKVGSGVVRGGAKAVTKVGPGVVRGGILVAGAMLIFGWALFTTLVVIVWQVTGMGPTIPVFIIGIATFVLLVMLLAPRLLSGRRSRT